MSEMAQALVAPGLERHADEVHAVALSDTNPNSVDVLTWVRGVRARTESPVALLSHYAQWTDAFDSRSHSVVASTDDRSSEPAGMRPAYALAAHCYFAAAVLTFFDDTLTRTSVDAALNGEPAPLEILRDARAALSINPAHVVSLVDDFRAVCGGMDET
jgi:hypothetical protein